MSYPRKSYNFTSRRKSTRSGRGGGIRGGRRGRNNKSRLLASVALPIVVLAGGGMAMNAYMSLEKPDADHCYTRSDQHKVALYIDSSIRGSDLSSAQLRDYERSLQRAYDAAPVNARVSIFNSAADQNATIIEPVFTACKPAETVSEQDAIGAPSKPAPYLKRQSEEARRAYAGAVRQIIADIQNPAKTAGDSPILEQIQSVSRHKYFKGSSRSLSVITDGIQNSEIARFCAVSGHMPPYAKFEGRSAYQHIRPDSFAGTNVSFLLVEYGKLPSRNYPYCTNDELRAWWPEYFKGNGANSVTSSRLRRWAE